MISGTPLNQKPLFGVSGHAGAGHVHSHSGFIQDDSAGFAVAVALIRKAYPANTEIASVFVRENTIEVVTKDGGVGTATARRGVTPYETELMQRSIGKDGILSQAVALQCFGRIYGQGVLETPVALQTAICRAVIDTFAKHHSEAMVFYEERADDSAGAGFGAHIDVNGSCIAVMAVLNASTGGIGPEEDLEGNVCLFDKRQAMESLGLASLPTIIIENKAYIPQISASISGATFFVRYNEEFDNPAIGKALYEAALHCHLPAQKQSDAYPRYTSEMQDNTVRLGEHISELGKRIQVAHTSSEKTKLFAELACLVSQDAGGVSYMSNELHRLVAGGGLVPGTAAVLSLVVSEAYIKQMIIPELELTEVDNYISIIVEALCRLSKTPEKAEIYLDRARFFDKEELEELLSSRFSSF